MGPSLTVSELQASRAREKVKGKVGIEVEEREGVGRRAVHMGRRRPLAGVCRSQVP